jgi:phosphate transport system substrate-binding protein
VDRTSAVQVLSRFLLLLGAVAAPVLLAVPEAARAARGLTIKGSDTMVILGQRWAERYMGAHAGEIVQITGGGSGTGIASLINGTTDLCMSSRPMSDDEKFKLRDRYKTLGVEIPVARDGLSLYVHSSNAVHELNLQQIRDIYLGRITNWKQVGGADTPIILYSRENSSGTYVYFKTHVLGNRDFSPRAQTLPGTAAVVNAVARDPNGIGYGGAAYAKGLRVLAVRKDAKSPAISPTPATVRDGSYPITRYLYFYARTKPSGKAKAFVDYVLSDAGQGVVTEVGYFPVR